MFIGLFLLFNYSQAFQTSFSELPLFWGMKQNCGDCKFWSTVGFKLTISLRKLAHAFYTEIFPLIKIENFIRKILILLKFLLKTYIVGTR